MPVAVTGSVHSFDVSIGVDGPGTRFVAFLAGCPLRCLYCHSPDTWSARSGAPTSSDDLLLEIRRYQRFLQVAHGGVTVSGGEPLRQPRFVRTVLEGCREMRLHTALDTSGFLGERADDALLTATDLVLLDIKASDPATYRRVTRTGDLAPTVAFARRLERLGKPMWIRFVLVPGLTDDPDTIAGLGRLCASLDTVERVEILPFHRLGAHKYTALGMRFPLADVAPPAAGQTDEVRDRLRSYGLTVT